MFFLDQLIIFNLICKLCHLSQKKIVDKKCYAVTNLVISKYMPNCGCLPTKGLLLFSRACDLVVWLEHKVFSICLSCQGKSGFESLCCRFWIGYPMVGSWVVVRSLNFFKTRSSLLALVHSKIKFRDGPHQIGPNWLFFATSWSSSSRLSWQNLVNTWQNPVTTNKTLSDNINGLLLVASDTGIYGDINLLRALDWIPTNESRCLINRSSALLGLEENLDQNSFKGRS